MPRGPNLTPEQVGTLAEVYARTGSYVAAGAAIGVDKSVARRCLLRVGWSPMVTAHAREIDAGLERGRRALDGIVREVRQRTRTAEMRSTLTLDELLAAAKTASYGVSRLVDLAELELKRRTASLTRRKLRAEAKALEKGAMPTIDQVLAILAALPEAELRAAVAQLRDARSAPITSTTGTM